MPNEPFTDGPLLERLSSKFDDETRRALEATIREAELEQEGAARLIRYLENVGSPGAILAQMQSAPQCARLFLKVVATSKQLSDLVVQNPELAEMVLNPALLTQELTVQGVVLEGQRLLTHAVSYAHQLDRIRFLKQKAILQTAALDLGEMVPQQEIWNRLSDLAEGVLMLARDVVWEKVRDGGHEETCPVSIVAMGKFGGRELNYSSDLDLVFVAPDDTDEDQEMLYRKFAEKLRGALADRMGRGDLYRVDLRLRPFGTQGPLVSRMRAMESYYANYAEAWEHQAMIRTKVMGEDENIKSRWQALRETVAFKGKRGSWVLDNMEAMRRKIEQHSDDEDLKRGPGGIRDIEFLVQALQLIHGGAHPAVRQVATLDALGALQSLGLVPQEVAGELEESYEFLRKLEHRCQIISGMQTHKLPSDASGRQTVARAMGFKTVHALQNSLEHHRVRTRRWYESVFLRHGSPVESSSAGAQAWFSALPGGDRFSESVQKNASSLARVTKVLNEAPALVPYLRTTVALTEQVLSGEIEESGTGASRYVRSGREGKTDEFTRAARNGWCACLLRWLLVPGVDLGLTLSEHTDMLVRAVFEDVKGVTGVVGLGSYGSEDCAPTSDADVIVFVDDECDRRAVERELKDRAAFLQAAKSAGSPVAVDFRLRPEGRFGRLGVAPSAFEHYEATAMETWERFAMARCRLVFGSEGLAQPIARAAFGRPLDDGGLDDLLHMKKRIENERVSHKVRMRHLKLGNGTMDDIVWLVQLWFMRHPWMAEEEPSVRTTDRIKALVNSELVTVVEGDELIAAWSFLYELRTRLFLTGCPDDVLPENPDRLEKLGATMGLGDANGILREFQDRTRAVRGIFEEAQVRMRS